VLSSLHMMRTQLLLVVVAALFLTHPAAADDVPFVERPLTLAPWQVSADIGVGLAQTNLFYEQRGSYLEPAVSPTYRVGWGGSLESAIGLPYVGQLGLRVGYTPDSLGRFASADQFGRLLDPIHAPPGNGAPFTGPELDWKRTIFAPSVFEIGVDVRLLFSVDGRFHFGLAAGVPVRMHLAPWLRLDTGLYVSADAGTPGTGGFQLPAQLFFQAGDTFFGPELTIFPSSPSLAAAFPVGLAVGHTFGGVVDVKAEARVNDLSLPEHSLSGGIGVGVRF
jgi:hypothetical protein